LTGAYYTQPGRDLYGRLTVGYLETMYGGISSELLWAPSDSRLAFGGELNYVEQRDFDGGLGFQDYSIWTGHASAYYRVTDDFFVQLDAGRYLAGDYGGTVTIERVFTNGWRVGAFATFTDVSAEDFGEGSFDKGLTMTVPLGWLFGKSSSVIQPLTLRPITRDGGARLRVDGRLYETIEPSQNHRLEQQWGRFWR
ncbi:MAG: YjbH domain-containing protein, partial [Mangrovicoccus sp.]